MEYYIAEDTRLVIKMHILVNTYLNETVANPVNKSRFHFKFNHSHKLRKELINIMLFSINYIKLQIISFTYLEINSTKIDTLYF